MRLNGILIRFLIEVKKKDGSSEYELDALLTIKRGFKPHLDTIKYPGNILVDKQFETSRRILAAKRIAINVGLQGNNESQKLCWGDIILELDPETNGKKFTWYKECGNKTRMVRPLKHFVKSSELRLQVRLIAVQSSFTGNSHHSALPRC